MWIVCIGGVIWPLIYSNNEVMTHFNWMLFFSPLHRFTCFYCFINLSIVGAQYYIISSVQYRIFAYFKKKTSL